MKKWISVIVVLAPSIAAPQAQADVKPEALLLTGNVAYMWSKSHNLDGQTIDGGSVTLNIERLIKDNPTSIGLMIGTMSSEGSALIEDEGSVNVEYSAVPVMITGRYFLGTGDVPMYVGLGVGVHFAETEVTKAGTSETIDTVKETNFTAAVPLGVLAFLGEDSYINFSFTLQYVAASFDIDTSLLFNFALGIGFQFE